MITTDNSHIGADVDSLVARVDFFESCVDQLRRELPIYLNKQSGIDKHHKTMAKLLRSVGSSETNQKLQNVMFRFSQKNEIFEKERAVFAACEHSLQDAVDESKKLLILPLKEIIADQKALMKANPDAGTTGIAANAPAASSASKPSKSDISDAQFVQSTLQVHAKLFEKHRVQSLKKVLHTWLSAELRYHCKVVEELSAVLQDLALVDENEE